MNPKEVVEAFISATNDKNWENARNLLADEVKRHSSVYGGPHIASKTDLIEFHKSELQTFPDLRESIHFMIREKDIVAARIHFKGTQLGMLGNHPPSGNVLDAFCNCFFRVQNDMILETWVEYDQYNGLVQLGHIIP